jgi:hypothetical protein
MTQRIVTVNDILDGHVLLDIECLERIYLNAYVPILQSSGQVVAFMTQHLGMPIPSPALMEKISTRFRRPVESFASANGIPWQIDELGLTVARLVVLLLVPPGEPLTVAVDDSVFRRSGRKVHEQAFADARNVPGAGEARNRTRRAVERTVPFALLTCTLIITCYARHGHHRAGITARRHAQPWYHAKTEPAFKDMLTQLGRVLITARIAKGSSTHPTPEQTKAVLAAWQAAAA